MTDGETQETSALSGYLLVGSGHYASREIDSLAGTNRMLVLRYLDMPTWVGQKRANRTDTNKEDLHGVYYAGGSSNNSEFEPYGVLLSRDAGTVSRIFFEELRLQRLGIPKDCAETDRPNPWPPICVPEMRLYRAHLEDDGQKAGTNASMLLCTLPKGAYTLEEFMGGLYLTERSKLLRRSLMEGNRVPR